MPMPAFAPVEKVEEEVENEVCGKKEVAVGSDDWAVPVSDRVLNDAGFVTENENEEEDEEEKEEEDEIGE